MTRRDLTLEDAIELRDEALSSTDAGAMEVAGVLEQLIELLQPKVIQITTIEEDVIVALKSDGTLHKSMGGLVWTQLKTP